MEYFCYISRTKVDQLYHSLSPRAVDAWTETQTSERDFEGSASAGLSLSGIVELFKSGITYGRKNVVQREQTVKVHYVEKLGAVLWEIAREGGTIPPLESASPDNEGNHLYYAHKGSFVLAEPLRDLRSDQVVTLQTPINGGSLLLDCSLRFFSEGNEEEGTFLIHSGNARFFSGALALTFETVLVLMGRSNENLVGSPLYLKYTPYGEFATL